MVDFENKSSNEEYDDLMRFLYTVYNTKELPRQGLLLAGYALDDVDSVASHSYIVSVLAYIIASLFRTKYDFIVPENVLKMAIFHDIAESITGDSGRYVKLKLKKMWRQVEKLALQELSKSVPFLKNENSIPYLVDLYNQRDSSSAWIVKVADVLDAAIQSNLKKREHMKSNTGYPGEAGLSRYDRSLISEMNSVEKTARIGGEEIYALFIKDLRLFFEHTCLLIRKNLLKKITL